MTRSILRVRNSASVAIRLCSLFAMVSAADVLAQRQMEHLGRGVVAVRQDDGSAAIAVIVSSLASLISTASARALSSAVVTTREPSLRRGTGARES